MQKSICYFRNQLAQDNCKPRNTQRDREERYFIKNKGKAIKVVEKDD